MKQWVLSELAKELGVSVKGDSTILVDHLATLQNARQGSLSFLSNPLYQAQLESSKASAVIVAPDFVEQCPSAALISDNPYLTYAKASRLFDNTPALAPIVHASAVVADDVKLGNDVAIGANCVIDAGVTIGDGVEIGSGCVIGSGSSIGAYTRLRANVTFYHGVQVGERCHFHSGSVIGADGFGFAPVEGGWYKIAQLGGVQIGNDVDVGANTTIDRGAIDPTKIGNGVVLDNQIQIAHNVEIGDFTAIAGCTGIAGSTKIGRYCTIAGAVGIAGHLEICDKVHITMRSAITRSISSPGSYSSGTAMSTTAEWRKSAARFRQLDSLARSIRKLERKLSR
ncbi:MAG: UDP-3-O-(3-hydroxymyristoyl)glucosamine N-acyltransferase [Gammaproteobacteria bacterium]|nr:MAG: UDP-3-O-(3-hydroxymyristoyl)glucosamine N-acyltransferase [Gammaproteobacteria bacterium]